MDLKELAAETTTEGESRMLMEAIEPMEKFLAAAIAFLPKRKAESDLENEESGDEDEESGDENEESGDKYVDSDDKLMKATCWTPLEWEVDSFDGLEYHFSDEENEFPDEEHELIWRRFRHQLIENKGFDVEPDVMPMYGYSDFRFVGDLDMAASYGQTYRDYFAEMACLCLQKYNHEKGSNVEFVEVVRENNQGKRITEKHPKTQLNHLERDGQDSRTFQSSLRQFWMILLKRLRVLTHVFIGCNEADGYYKRSDDVFEEYWVQIPQVVS